MKIKKVQFTSSKKYISILLLLVLNGCSNKEYNYICDDKYIYTNINNYDICFYNNSDFDSFDDKLYIYDGRNNNNPVIKIVDSYKIIKLNDMNEIIDIIIDYDKKYPNEKWNRNKLSMLIEWYFHNYLYYKNMYLDHTKDVDFNEKELVKKI